MAAGILSLSPRLMYLNSRTLVGATVWRDLRGGALLEDVCHQEQDLRFQSLTILSVFSISLPPTFSLLFLSLLYAVVQGVNSQLPAPASTPVHCFHLAVQTLIPWTVSQN